MVTAFEVLGLMPDASEEEIQTAYYRKAKIYHPDLGGSAEDFLEIKRAYDILSNSSKRELLGSRPMFMQPLIRLRPSLSASTSQLFENLSTLSAELKLSNR
jgi:curved DNA-binding protein CbpA